MENSQNAKFVKQVKREIEEDESLGEGFKIGHSYLSNLEPDDDIDEKLRCIVEYELIPLLKEYWFDEPLKIKEGSNILRRVFDDEK